MPTVVLKLFAGQGTGQTVKAATICFPPFGDHNKINNYKEFTLKRPPSGPTENRLNSERVCNC